MHVLIRDLNLICYIIDISDHFVIKGTYMVYIKEISKVKNLEMNARREPPPVSRPQ